MLTRAFQEGTLATVLAESQHHAEIDVNRCLYAIVNNNNNSIAPDVFEKFLTLPQLRIRADHIHSVLTHHSFPIVCVLFRRCQREALDSALLWIKDRSCLTRIFVFFDKFFSKDILLQRGFPDGCVSLQSPHHLSDAAFPDNWSGCFFFSVVKITCLTSMEFLQQTRDQGKYFRCVTCGSIVAMSALEQEWLNSRTQTPPTLLLQEIEQLTDDEDHVMQKLSQREVRKSQILRESTILFRLARAGGSPKTIQWLLEQDIGTTYLLPAFYEAASFSVAKVLLASAHPLRNRQRAMKLCLKKQWHTLLWSFHWRTKQGQREILQLCS